MDLIRTLDKSEYQTSLRSKIPGKSCWCGEKGRRQFVKEHDLVKGDKTIRQRARFGQKKERVVAKGARSPNGRPGLSRLQMRGFVKKTALAGNLSKLALSR